MIHDADHAIWFDSNSIDGKVSDVRMLSAAPFFGREGRLTFNLRRRRKLSLQPRVAKQISMPNDLSVAGDSCHMPAVAFDIEH